MAPIVVDQPASLRAGAGSATGFVVDWLARRPRRIAGQ